MSNYKYGNGGHAPGRVREAFVDAIEAWYHWDGVGPEPTVAFEVKYVPRQITLSQACGLVWNCSDVLPGGDFDLVASDLDVKRQTYAAVARAMRSWLDQRQASAA